MPDFEPTEEVLCGGIRNGATSTQLRWKKRNQIIAFVSFCCME
jgi:hypothetical protein